MRQSCSESLVSTSPCGQGMIPRTARRILSTTKPGTSDLWRVPNMATTQWMTFTTNTRHVSQLRQSPSALFAMSCVVYFTVIYRCCQTELEQVCAKGICGPYHLHSRPSRLLCMVCSENEQQQLWGSDCQQVLGTHLLGYFHGYIKASEWQRGRYIPAEAMHGITFRRDITRQANINAKEVAQTADDGYEASNKKYLEDSEMAEISASLWNSKSAYDCLLYHCFSSFGSQTLIRDSELLLLQRMRSCLSESSQYQTSFGPLKLMEVVSKGAQKTNKTNLLYSWMIRRREIDHLCPFLWGAAHLFHDYQRMQPGKPGNLYGSLVEVMRDNPSGNFNAFDALVHG